MSEKSKEFVGQVVSTKMQKTVIVEVVQLRPHPLYKKAMRKSKHIPAHNDGLELVVGDRVRIAETKPISKTKHFRVVEKIG